MDENRPEANAFAIAKQSESAVAILSEGESDATFVPSPPGLLHHVVARSVGSITEPDIVRGPSRRLVQGAEKVFRVRFVLVRRQTGGDDFLNVGILDV